MRKMLIVGCGGSGAKTLAYMMDQLKAMLAERMPDVYPDPQAVKLPEEWGFVSIDVPVTAESFPDVRNVPDAGGTYISCGYASDSYRSVDSAVTSTLLRDDAINEMATWLVHDPERVAVPISEGAGQYRRLGRMLFLSQMGKVRAALEAAHGRVMNAYDLGPIRERFNVAPPKDESVTAIVVSSMAGGAGASMAIDVCEVLNELVPPQNTIMFAVTPDIFSTDGEGVGFAGTNPNSLGMFSELTSAQYGEALRADRALFDALGASMTSTEGFPFRRVFPVGAHFGTDGKSLGDATVNVTQEVYRALARGLAGLMINHKAMQDFWAYSVTNPNAPAPKTKTYGWGVDKEEMAWGSFGYAQLSTGRDRYAEYAAQRLSRQTVEQLLTGHLDPNAQGITAETQRVRLYDKHKEDFLDDFGSVVPAGSLKNWFFGTGSRTLASGPQALIRQWIDTRRANLMQQLQTVQGGRAASDVLSDINTVINNFSWLLANDTDDKVMYQAVAQWASESEVQDRTMDMARRWTIRYSAPFALHVVRKFREFIEQESKPLLRTMASQGYVPWIPQEKQAELSSSGKVADVTPYHLAVMAQAERNLQVAAAQLFARLFDEVLDDYTTTFLAPLERAMSQGIDELQKDMEKLEDKSVGVAQIKTDVPALWPAPDDTQPARRFKQAANEVFLTSIDRFPARFVEHIGNSVQKVRRDADNKLVVEEMGYNQPTDQALKEAASLVASGDWPMPDGKNPPRGMLTLDIPWVPEHARAAAGLERGRDQQDARFTFAISAAKVLGRARLFINRQGYEFHRFISTSLAEYVRSINEDDGDKRAHIVQCFNRAKDLALPLAQLSQPLISEIYGGTVKYRFTFSPIPFGADPELKDTLNQSFAQDARVEKTGVSAEAPLERNFTSQGKERHIDIIGSYPNYAPITFRSVMKPIVQQRDKTRQYDNDFWKDRRARSLPGALPMSGAERRAMIAGWYIGWLTGRLAAPFDNRGGSDRQPVQVFAHSPERGIGQGTWLKFECPLLTGVHRMGHPKLDWLPAVLETYALSVARCGAEQNLQPLAPYVALRSLYDDSPMEPSNESMHFVGEDILAEWLWTGKRHAERWCLVKGTGPEESVDARYEAAMRWLKANETVVTRFLPRNRGGDGTFFVAPASDLVIHDRDQAEKMPLIADISEDVVRMLRRVQQLLTTAHENPPSDAYPDLGAPQPPVQTPTTTSATFIDPELDSQL